MKSLQESLLGDEDILMDNTDIELIKNNSFPKKNNIVTLLKDPRKTKYYVWECPTIFNILDQKIPKSFYKNNRYKNKISFVISWHKCDFYDNSYVIKLYMADASKADVQGHCTSIAVSSVTDYTLTKAKQLAYDILSAIKDNPEKLLKYEFGFKLEELLK